MKRSLAVVLTGVLSLGLAACGQSEDKLVVGASVVPHAEILEHVKPLLEEKGIELEIKTFKDYVLPNKALASEDLDANFFQHIPYLEQQIAENDYKFTNVASVHIEPIGVYSKRYKDIKDLPNGATVLLSNSVADHGRVLSLFESQGLITLKDDVKKSDAKIEDIVENPKNLSFEPKYDAALLSQIYNKDQADLVVINTNYALEAGLNPLKDSLFLEGSESPYVNILVSREDNKNEEGIQALAEVLTSQEVQQWIADKYDGKIVPVNLEK
ncbi:MAG: MetQ/NlpA family ABC transporter substrate-binding protein [Bacilli bacterium]